MKITVAICTWNRCELLRQALEQMAHLTIPTGVDWELLVINNNSTDNTDAVIDSFVGKLPIRRYFEPKPGLSNARNCAIQHLKGEYILWTDDDISVGTEWLNEYWKAACRWPDAAFFGGPILLRFEGRSPKWLVENMSEIGWLLGASNVSRELTQIKTNDKIPNGGNFGIRTDIQKRYMYDPNHGRKPNDFAGGEETEVMRAILEAGMYGYWIPTNIVYNYLPKERQTIAYVRKCVFDNNRYFTCSDESIKKILGLPRWALCGAPLSEILYRVKRLLMFPSTSWVPDMLYASKSWGALHKR